ncbi:MAG: hypothetical protein QM737_19865 [Ferruginibacter sp.]
MGKEFVYLLGAGASAGTASSYGDDSMLSKFEEEKNENKIKQVIPSVYNMRYRVGIMIEKVSSEIEDVIIKRNENTLLLNDKKKELINDLKWFHYMLGREPYVDILAETLYNTSVEEYKKLTNILSLYLIFEQCFNGVDLRYKSFITTLMSASKNGNSLPKGVNILSWNYDYQLEEAMVEKRRIFANKESIIEKVLGHIFIRNSAFFDEVQKVNKIDFPIIKLNGCSATLIDKENSDTVSYIPQLILTSSPYQYKIEEQKKRLEFIYNIILEYYLQLKSEIGEHRPSISFAWDKSKQSLSSTLSKVEFLKTYEVLIVIGYSFPSLNFYIDRVIVSSPFLKNIYVQCLEKDFKSIESRIMNLCKDNKPTITRVNDVNEFFVPFELQEYIMEYE